jgi:pyruvate/2-oxoglutarate dehydrogenase complex dihydrolipoamide dehydrogenase (E3) component
MDRSIDTDICVIGGEAAAVQAAIVCTAFGIRTLLVAPRAGATDPARAEAAIRSLAASMRGGGEPGAAFTRALRRVREAVAAVALDGAPERAAAAGVAVLGGEPRFLDARHVQVGDARLKARRFILAPGARPRLPAVEGLAALPLLTADRLADLEERPKRLIVLGADPDGLALAQAFARLGSDVVLVDAGEVLPGAPREFAEALATALARDGVAIRERAAILRAEGGERVARLVLGGPDGGEEEIEGTHLLVSAGWEPLLDGLDLAAAGIAPAAAGIDLDARLRTPNRRVYGVGAIAGAGSAAQARLQASAVARHAVFASGRRPDDASAPRCVHTDPPLALVGSFEGAVRLARFPLALVPAAGLAGGTPGHAAIALKRDGTVLGAGLLGAGAHEASALWAAAIGQCLKIDEIAAMTPPAAPACEASQAAALAALGEWARSPGLRRLARWLRILR